jgi:uncharacterized membrane protein
MYAVLFAVAALLIGFKFFASVFSAILNNTFVIVVVLVVVGLCIYKNDPEGQRKQAQELRQQVEKALEKYDTRKSDWSW